MMGFPARLVLRETCNISFGQQHRSTVAAFLSSASAQGGEINGRIGFSLSAWRRFFTNARDSGGVEIEKLWNEYFADPSQWWDNRVDKRNPRSPDLKHKVTRKALWVDGWSTPPWVKAMLTEDKFSSKRPPKSNNGNGYSQPTYMGEWRQIIQDDAGMDLQNARKHLQNASTTREAIVVLKNCVQQGIVVDSYTYVEVLQRCFKQRDLVSAKQVHDCIIKTAMEQNIYVANNLLRVYIRCGRLQDARVVFDKLVKKSIFSWTIMIGGYAQHDHAEDAMEVFNLMCQEGMQPDEIAYLNILKACVGPVALKWGKQVHAHIKRGGFESDVRVGTALMKMYASCGKIDDALFVFDRVQDRDVMTWTVMIGGLAQHGRGHEAYQLFLQMQRGGFVPDAFTYASILNACASTGALEWVKEVHSHAVKAGLELDLRVGSALVHMYAKCGSIDDACLVFGRMKHPDDITWNVMIGGLAQHGRGLEAYELFLNMQEKGFVPNESTYVSILNPCASTGALEWVKEVHNHALKAGLDSSLRVGSALIHMYAKCGGIDDARVVFDKMQDRGVMTWTVMIGGLAQHGRGHEAYQLFLQMHREGIVPDAFTYVSILNACASIGALEWVKDVHSHAIKAGLELDLRVGNALIHMYAKCGNIDDALLVFDRMVDRNVSTWNVMIGGLAQHECGHQAYELFLQMQKEGIVPDAFTYVNVWNACASTGALEWVKEVHSHAVKAGLELDLRVGSALVHMYAKCGNIDDARRVFNKMEDRNVITWNVMIGGLAQHGCGLEAYQLFLQMQREGFIPNERTFVSLLNPCASAGALDWVKDVHNHAVKGGLELDLRVGSALVHMYGKSGNIDDARLIFDRMEDRDIITWTMMIGGLAQHGRGHEALQLFEKMKGEGVKPNEFLFVAVLSACSHAGLVNEGRRQFLAMSQEYGIEPSVEHYTCMVDLLGRAGHLEEAKLVIQNMPLEPDGATWGALLVACRTHVNVELAEHAAKERLKLEPLDASTYVLLSNIYASAGKWDQVSLLRNMMHERGIRKEPGCSWIEVDTKIHHFVVGDTSHPESKEIYAELNRLAEILKAEGYIPDTRLVLHNISEEDKELALCSHSEKLAIAYGLLRVAGGKPIRIFKNLRVCSDCHTATKFISKITGREIVARDANRFHHFKNGVCSCGDYW